MKIFSSNNNHGIPSNGVKISAEIKPFLKASFLSNLSVPNLVVAILIVAMKSIIMFINKIATIGPMNAQINPSSKVTKQCSLEST